MYTVPYSELAMHMRIAGKNIVAYRWREYSTLADVWIEGQDPYQDVSYSGLECEVLPFELRHDRNDGKSRGEIVLVK